MPVLGRSDFGDNIGLAFFESGVNRVLNLDPSRLDAFKQHLGKVIQLEFAATQTCVGVRLESNGIRLIQNSSLNPELVLTLKENSWQWLLNGCREGFDWHQLDLKGESKILIDIVEAWMSDGFFESLFSQFDIWLGEQFSLIEIAQNIKKYLTRLKKTMALVPEIIEEGHAHLRLSRMLQSQQLSELRRMRQWLQLDAKRREQRFITIFLTLVFVLCLSTLAILL
jgi:hypothetical protein